MKGFWDTWMHIFVGLAFATTLGGIVFMIYDTGRIHGQDQVRQTYYDKGYGDGYSQGYWDRSMGYERSPRREGK